jgi:hypothetical protein
MTSTVTPPPPPEDSIITTTILPIGGEVCLNTRSFAIFYWEQLMSQELRTKHNITYFIANYSCGSPGRTADRRYPVSRDERKQPSCRHCATIDGTYRTGIVANADDRASAHLDPHTGSPTDRNAAAARRGEPDAPAGERSTRRKDLRGPGEVLRVRFL